VAISKEMANKIFVWFLIMFFIWLI
jgi:hypothetical protein